MNMHSILVISLSAPLLVGIYHDKKLIKSYKSDEKTSEKLPLIFEEILDEYEVSELLYAKGPGSFMAIKITYIFLNTLSIVKNIPLKATSGFSFNQNSPIKAIGSRYFMKKNDTIVIEKLAENIEDIKLFELPKALDSTIFSDDNQPLYILPAV